MSPTCCGSVTFFPGRSRGVLSSSFAIFWLFLLQGCAVVEAKEGPWYDVKVANGLLLVRTTSGPPNSFYVLDTGSSACAIDAGYMETQSFFDIAAGSYLPTPDAPYAANDLGYLVDADLTGISKACGIRVIGIIGERYFHRHIIQIDYARGRIRELSKGKLKAGDAGEPLELWVDHEHFYTKIDVNGKRLEKVLIDTGSTGFLTLDEKTADDLGVASGKGQKIKGTTVYGEDAGVGYRPDSLEVQGMKFERPGIAVFPAVAGAGPNALGNEFFSHYTVTLDAAGGALYLKPIEQDKAPATQPAPETAAAEGAKSASH